jgi:aminopeptidase N
MAVQGFRSWTRASIALVLFFALDTLAGAGEAPRQWGRDRDVDLEHLRIDLRLDMEKGRVEGNAQLTVAGLQNGTSEMSLDAREMEVTRVSVGGREAAFRPWRWVRSASCASTTPRSRVSA